MRHNLLRYLIIPSLCGPWFALCHVEVESTGHLFVHCKVVLSIWLNVLKWMRMPLPLMRIVLDLFEVFLRRP